ncbi:MAG: hypothetical protein CMJ18_25990 [Phycisphaeraceae bacterium]|nr:hypothetical protein [Phycisphaeraceae bacterium]
MELMTESSRTNLPAGEHGDVDLEHRRTFRILQSGALFRYDLDGSGPAYSYTSGADPDDPKVPEATWTKGGELMSYRGPIQGLNNASLQLEGAEHRGRIVLPFYLQMDGQHPDYTREQRGGYATYQGKTILLETHTHVPEMSGSFMVYSDDEGQSWSTSDGFMMGYFDHGNMGFTTADEPIVAELSDGRLLCYLRSTCGRIVRSHSGDGGATWSKVEPTDLANSNSPCALARIDGTTDLVLIWNQVSAEEIRAGYRRGRLSLAVSRDDGETWQAFKTLERVSTLEDIERIEPPALTSMVRGACGSDTLMGSVPDDLAHYGYPEIYFFGDGMLSVCYKQHRPTQPLPVKWRTFPVSSLYEPASS